MADEIVASAVFDRIRALYDLPSDAAMARRLGIYPQDVPRQRKSGNVPFAAILTSCPPKDWSHIFLGEATLDPLEAARAALVEKGYRMILEPLPAAQPPRSEAEGSP